MNGSGYRSVPHTADLRIEAWAPTRDECIAQAVRGAVASFADISSAGPGRVRKRPLTADGDEDLLVAVLDEVIYLLDTAGEIPIDVVVESGGGTAEARFSMVDAAAVPQIGAVPKAVSLHELRLDRGPEGWSCSVTLDV
ncbi:MULTISPECIES: archease [Rhodococcus]|uniref:archease n=1 Tax=Rhodococcus TaxID=1827 RepID=UPI00203F4C74|nr:MULTISPECIES: archease [Rhodococcus]USC14771.1 archease [Rhodococcus sp. 11-3]WFS11184.1 archease [Rhodococcus aetherivorans]